MNKYFYAENYLLSVKESILAKGIMKATENIYFVYKGQYKIVQFHNMNLNFKLL